MTRILAANFVDRVMEARLKHTRVGSSHSLGCCVWCVYHANVICHVECLTLKLESKFDELRDFGDKAELEGYESDNTCELPSR